MSNMGRDYSLTGTESKRAVERGLAEAEWYLPPVEPGRLQDLMVRNNGRAARDTIMWLGLLAGAGSIAWLALGTLWSVPAFVAYGLIYGGTADSRWHEAGHGTAFRSSRLNSVLYNLAAFMLMRVPTLWRWSHVRHHTDTIVVGRDPEIIFPRPTGRWSILATFTGLRVLPPMVWRMIKHAFGQLDDNTKEFVPQYDWRRLVWESRAFLGVQALAVVLAIVGSSVVPLLYVGIVPTWIGVPLLIFFGLPQHCGLREDVLDHRLNTRTVYMGRFSRFLYSNMNYHVEHHMFPTVPYHALPELHEEVKDYLAPATGSIFVAYREILSTVPRQAIEPSHELSRPELPSSDDGDSAQRIDVGEYLWEQSKLDGRFDVGAAMDLAVGDVRRVDIGAHTYAVYRLAEDEYAITDGVCTHGQAHLAEGLFLDCTIECPKHNGRFDVRTGSPLRLPVRDPIATYEVDVVDGRIVSDLIARTNRETAV